MLIETADQALTSMIINKPIRKMHRAGHHAGDLPVDNPAWVHASPAPLLRTCLSIPLTLNC